MSVLQAINAGVFENSPSVLPNLQQVLSEGNTTSLNIISSGAITSASMATQTLNASSNITTSGSVILTQGGQSISNNAGALVLGTSAVSSCLVNGGIQMQNNCTVKGALEIQNVPLQCNYPTFVSSSSSPTSIGYILGETYVGLSVAMNNSSVETLLYQTAVVVPLGVWMITARVGFSSTDPPSTSASVFFNCGLIQNEIPSTNFQAAIRSNVGYVNFTNVFQSITNLQSPTFLYQCNTANITVGDISWKAIRIG